MKATSGMIAAGHDFKLSALTVKVADLIFIGESQTRLRRLNWRPLVWVALRKMDDDAAHPAVKSLQRPSIAPGPHPNKRVRLLPPVLSPGLAMACRLVRAGAKSAGHKPIPAAWIEAVGFTLQTNLSRTMSPRRIALIQGHPNPGRAQYGHALADAYLRGATASGHTVKSIEVAELSFPLLRSQADWGKGTLPPTLQPAQEIIGWADHLVIIFPLWLGTTPALLQAFFEQVLRPSFAFHCSPGGVGIQPALKGKSARVVVTMGMPAFLCRWFFFAPGVSNFRRYVLGSCGIGPIHGTYIGKVEAKDSRAREQWLVKLQKLGSKGS
jgi:putative NADPH-quinone reductase